ncbi:MAG: tyrosine-type recombinase/integrase [Clostridiaceae bacterium]|nr:tyrosine-type recombinase/integrase [Clostridiaceae bacterium]
MPNKKTLALTEETYTLIIQTIMHGFSYDDGKVFNPNARLAHVLTLQANLGLRIGDVLSLRLNSFVKDGDRYRLDIDEEKTGKARTFTVPIEIYNYVKMYALEHSIKPTAKLFDITERAIQKQLKIVCDYLELSSISTHSFRKYFATQIYLESNYNIQLVSKLLQHSSIAITQKYIGIQSKDIEEALQKHIKIVSV